MGTFELGSSKIGAGNSKGKPESELIAERIGNHHREHEDNVIALKVYDSCRQRECLGCDELGPARAAEFVIIDHEEFCEGDIIKSPCDAATVTIEKLKVKKIMVTDKKPSPFRTGYWDICLKYVFEFELLFYDEEGCQLEPCPIKAMCSYNKAVCLFGSVGADVTVSTDLFDSPLYDSATVDLEPYVFVECKAVVLKAEIEREGSEERGIVLETFGMFSIIKIFRIVPLIVESKGFCLPQECEDIHPISPCEHFENLDFPIEFFAPPGCKLSEDGKPCGC